MQDDSVQNTLKNVTRRVFVSTGAAAIFSVSVGIASGEETAGGQAQGEPLPSGMQDLQRMRSLPS
jgi:hypothetical protein